MAGLVKPCQPDGLPDEGVKDQHHIGEAGGDGDPELVRTLNLEVLRPERVDRTVVIAVGGTAWKCRLGNRVNQGRASEFRVNRPALDALHSCNNETDAIALYVLLVDLHGQTPGKWFALDFTAMRALVLNQLSIARLRAARCSLQAEKLLAVMGNQRAGSVHRTYSLTRMRSATNDPSRIATMPWLQGPRKEWGPD